MTALTDTRDHARRMAGTSTTPAKEAALWLQIATEIDAYEAHLAEDQPPAEGAGLWEDA